MLGMYERPRFLKKAILTVFIVVLALTVFLGDGLVLVQDLQMVHNGSHAGPGFIVFVYVPACRRR